MMTSPELIKSDIEQLVKNAVKLTATDLMATFEVLGFDCEDFVRGEIERSNHEYYLSQNTKCPCICAMCIGWQDCGSCFFNNRDCPTTPGGSK